MRQKPSARKDRNNANQRSRFLRVLTRTWNKDDSQESTLSPKKPSLQPVAATLLLSSPGPRPAERPCQNGKTPFLWCISDAEKTFRAVSKLPHERGLTRAMVLFLLAATQFPNTSNSHRIAISKALAHRTVSKPASTSACML